MNGWTILFGFLPWILVVFPSCILGSLICIIITPIYYFQVKLSNSCSFTQRPTYFIIGVAVVLDLFCDVALFIDASDRETNLDIVRLFLTLSLWILSITSSLPFGLGQLLCLNEFEIQKVEVLYSVSYAVLGPLCACYSRICLAFKRKVSFAIRAATLWDLILLSMFSYCFCYSLVGIPSFILTIVEIYYNIIDNEVALKIAYIKVGVGSLMALSIPSIAYEIVTVSSPFKTVWQSKDEENRPLMQENGLEKNSNEIKKEGKQEVFKNANIQGGSNSSLSSSEQLQSVGSLRKEPNSSSVASVFIPIALLAFMAKASLFQDDEKQKDEEKRKDEEKVQPVVYNIYNTGFQNNSVTVSKVEEVHTESLLKNSSRYVSSEKRNETNLKIVIIGDISVGKSSLLRLFSGKGEFSPNYKATIGVDFALKTIPLSPNEVLQIQLWDIAGQEKYGNMTRLYYKDAYGVAFCFDLSQRKSFQDLRKWKKDVWAKCMGNYSEHYPVPSILIGCKSDLSSERVVQSEEIEEWTKENGNIKYFEVSAKNYTNVDEAMLALVKDALIFYRGNENTGNVSLRRFANSSQKQSQIVNNPNKRCGF